jgi:UDP-N-acetyl-D-glucosamine dehydrogenase
VQVGHEVIGFEKNIERVNRLAQGDSFVEDVNSMELRAALRSGSYVITNDLARIVNFDVLVITVPTPLREGAPDLSFIEKSAVEIAPYITVGSTVILESTTYPGTTDELLVPLLNAGSGLIAGEEFHVGFSPERIDPGNPRFNFVNTPKVVSGINATSLEAVEKFYKSIVDQIVPVKGCREAELAKLLENTFRHVNIALVNELAMYANDLGIDIWDVINAASTKPFGFLRFTPGPGVGGHCLPIDPSYLSWHVEQSLNRPFRFVELANDVNEHMPNYVVNRIMLSLNKQSKALNGARLLLLGLAYKKNSGDARESPAVHVAQQLVAMGADVRVVDPVVIQEFGSIKGTKFVELSTEELRNADVVVLLTDHDAFDYSLILKESKNIFDTRNKLPRSSNVEVL